MNERKHLTSREVGGLSTAPIFVDFLIKWASHAPVFTRFAFCHASDGLFHFGQNFAPLLLNRFGRLFRVRVNRVRGFSMPFMRRSCPAQ